VPRGGNSWGQYPEHVAEREKCRSCWPTWADSPADRQATTETQLVKIYMLLSYDKSVKKIRQESASVEMSLAVKVQGQFKCVTHFFYLNNYFSHDMRIVSSRTAINNPKGSSISYFVFRCRYYLSND
jgi:hypothetical protein